MGYTLEVPRCLPEYDQTNLVLHPGTPNEGFVSEGRGGIYERAAVRKNSRALKCAFCKKGILRVAVHLPRVRSKQSGFVHGVPQNVVLVSAGRGGVHEGGTVR